MTDETFSEMWNILKENDFQINVAVNSEIICIYCKNILIRPFNVPCGCRYCYDCLRSYLNGEEKFCLKESDYCKSVLINIDKNVFPDQSVNIKISRIVVKCPLDSCEFNTELGKMADHMIICERQLMTCPYRTIGCDDKKIGVNKMKHHLEHENYNHASLLMDFVGAWRNEMKLLKTNIENLQKENKCAKQQMETRIEELFQENKSLRNELETVKQDKIKQEAILSFQTKTEEQKQEIKTNTEKIKDLKQRYDEKCNQIDKNQEQMKTRLDKMSQENADITTQSKQIETKLTLVQANQNCGKFVWCIKNWEYEKNRVLTGIAIYSDPFYSHHNGYKMCLKLDNGDLGYLCLGICIMQGEFDNILQWPFRHGLKLELLNQGAGRAHVSKYLCYEDSPTSSAWNKPTREINNRIGIYQFIKLSETYAFLCQNNQIWIKATLQAKP